MFFQNFMMRYKYSAENSYGLFVCKPPSNPLLPQVYPCHGYTPIYRFTLYTSQTSVSGLDGASGSVLFSYFFYLVV